MTLDRRDYNTAIPQLEKRLEAVESVGDKSLADLDVLSSLLEKESAERERLYLKNVTQIQAVQATANGKNKIFRQNSQPTSGMADGDIWFDTSNDNKISRYNGSSWVAFTLGDDALDSLSANKLTAGTIDASVITVSNLDAGNITSGTLDASHIDASTLTIGGYYLTTTQDVSDAIEAIEIGGRNLVWDSHFQKPTERWTTWGTPTTREVVIIGGKPYLHIVSTSTAFQGYQQNAPQRAGYGEIEGGEQITVSLKAYASTNTNTSLYGFHWRDSGSIVAQSWGSCNVTTTEQTFKETFTVPSGATGFNLMIGDNKTVANELWITDVKVEKGNVATDWSPAPEDTQGFYYGECFTAGATADKTVTTDNSFYLHNGVAINVKFANTNSGAVASLTLEVNGTGAKPIKYINNTSVSNIPGVGYIVANYVYQFVYDGTNWVIQNLNYNSDTVDRHRINNNLKSGTVAITRNSICGYSPSASGFISLASAQSNNYAIDLSYPIVYLNSSSTLNASTNSTNFYDAFPSITLSYTKSGWNVSPYHKELYVKGTLNGRLLTLHSDLITTTVPNAKDGLAYIPIGYTYSTTAANFNYKDTVYAYKGGKFQEVGYGYANSHITEIGSDGIKVHDDNDTTNYVLIDSNGMDIVKNNDSTAFYGDYARVGSESSSRIMIYPSDIFMLNQDGAETFRVKTLDKTRSRYVYRNIGYWVNALGTGNLDIPTIMAEIPSNSSFSLYVTANGSPEATELQFTKGTTSTKTASYDGGDVSITYNGGTDIFSVDNTTSSDTSSVLGIAWMKSATWSRVEVDQLPLDYVVQQGHNTDGWDYVLWASGKAEAWLVVTWTGKLATSNGGWYSTNESDGIATANMPNEIFVYPNNYGQPIYRNVTVYQDLHGLSSAKNNVIPLLYNAENDYGNRYFGDVQLARGNSNSSNYTYVINCHVFIPPKSNWQDYI